MDRTENGRGWTLSFINKNDYSAIFSGGNIVEGGLPEKEDQEMRCGHGKEVKEEEGGQDEDGQPMSCILWGAITSPRCSFDNFFDYETIFHRGPGRDTVR